jgi:hypothetical protein
MMEPDMNDTEEEVGSLEKFSVWLKRVQGLRDSVLQQGKPSEGGSSQGHDRRFRVPSYAAVYTRR